MKFIKTYENFNISDLKKYAVWKWSNHNNHFDIIEIVDIIDNDIIWCKDIYTYEKYILNFVNSNRQSSFSYEMHGQSIIYTSDNLNDCLDYLNAIIDSIKYNL